MNTREFTSQEANTTSERPDKKQQDLIEAAKMLDLIHDTRNDIMDRIDNVKPWAKRALGVIAAVGATLGVVEAIKAQDEPIGCTTEMYQVGDNGIDPINRAIERLEQSRQGFSPDPSDTFYRAENLGLGYSHPGDNIRVCGYKNLVPVVGGDRVEITKK